MILSSKRKSAHVDHFVTYALYQTRLSKLVTFVPLYSSIQPSMFEGTVFCGQGFLCTPSIYVCIHALPEGHLQQHIFQQAMVYCRSRHVCTLQDKPDGMRDVLLPGVATQCTQHQSF